MYKWSCGVNDTYENNAFRSPLANAKSKGVPKQAGTKYSSAGCAWLNKCMMSIVASSPMKYAKNVE